MMLDEKISDKTAEKEIIYIDIDTIMPNRAQPRTFFESEALNELAESIKRYGILQPLTVRRLPESSVYSHYKYELIAGERRLRASKLLKMEKIPCILIESDTKTSAELAIIENLHRRDLNVFEEACAIASLIEIHKLTQEQIALKLGITQAAVANKLRLLKLNETERSLILAHNLTERHARALLRIKDEKERAKILQKIIEKSLNVKQTEDFIEEKLSITTKSPETPKVRETKNLIRYLKKAIERTRKSGTKIKTQQSETSNEIIFTISITK